MGRYRIEPATPEHVAEMSPNIRQADRDEVAASSNRTPEQALYEGLKRSDGYAWAGIADGEVVCIFGIAPMNILSDVGVPWMLGTPMIEKYATVFLKRSKKYVRGMCIMYPKLMNYVDDRNDVAKQWLQWLGFTLHEPEPYGVNGLPFRRFEMTGVKHV